MLHMGILLVDSSIHPLTFSFTQTNFEAMALMDLLAFWAERGTCPLSPKLN